MRGFGAVNGSKGPREPEAAPPESGPVDATVAVGVKRGKGMRPGEAKDVLTENCGEVEKRPRGCRFIDPTSDDGPGAIIPTAACAFVPGNGCEASDTDPVAFLASTSTSLFSRTLDSASDTTRCN